MRVLSNSKRTMMAKLYMRGYAITIADKGSFLWYVMVGRWVVVMTEADADDAGGWVVVHGMSG